MAALLEMVCITYQPMVCNACHVSLDIMNAFYYVPFIDENSLLLLIVDYGYTCIYHAVDCSIRNGLHYILTLLL